MNEIVCEYYKKPFFGRPDRKTCSIKCRRTLENKRRFWDTRFAYVRHCQTQADWDLLTAAQRIQKRPALFFFEIITLY